MEKLKKCVKTPLYILKYREESGEYYKKKINEIIIKQGLTTFFAAKKMNISIGNFYNKQSNKNIKENFSEKHLNKLK
jgi:hypothetical protein